MMNRSKLPEIASAVGLQVRNLAGANVYCLEEGQPNDALPTRKWNPIDSDADAFELLVKVGANVEINMAECFVCVSLWDVCGWQFWGKQDQYGTKEVATATRLAICECVYNFSKQYGGLACR